MTDRATLDLFAPAAARPGSFGCRAEIAATIAEALKRAAERGAPREEVAARMSSLLGEKVSVSTLNGYSAQSHTSQAVENGQPARDISLMRAMALDAATEEDALLNLFAAKRGNRAVISREDAALLEWARLHRQEKDLAERKRALEAVFRLAGGGNGH